MALPIEKLSEGVENFELVSSSLEDIKTINLDMLSGIKDIANSLKEQTKIELKEIKKDDKKEQIEKVKEDIKDDTKRKKEKSGFFATAAAGAAAGQAALGSNLALGSLLAGSMAVSIFDSIKEMIEKEGFFGTIKIGLEKFNTFFQDLTGINIAENLKKFNTWFSELTGINLGQSLNTFVTTLQGIKLEDLKTNFDTLVTGLGEAKKSFENITGINFSEEINKLKTKLASISVKDLVTTLKEFTDTIANIIVKLKPFIENWEATLAGLASAAAISMGVKKAVEMAMQKMLIKDAVTSALKGQKTNPSLTKKETVNAAEKGVRNAVKKKYLKSGVPTKNSGGGSGGTGGTGTGTNSTTNSGGGSGSGGTGGTGGTGTGANSTTKSDSGGDRKGKLGAIAEGGITAAENFFGFKAPEWTKSVIDATDTAASFAGVTAIVGLPATVVAGGAVAIFKGPSNNLSLLENVINEIARIFKTYDMIALPAGVGGLEASFKQKKSMLDAIDAKLSEAKQYVISLKNTGNRGLDANMKKKRDMLIQKYEDYVKRHNDEEKGLVEWNKNKGNQVNLGSTEQRIQAREAKSYSGLGGAQAVTGMTTKERKRLLRAALKLDTTISPDIDDTSGPPSFKSMLGFAASAAFETKGEKQRLNLAEKRAESKEKGGELILFSKEELTQESLDRSEMAENIKVLADAKREEKQAGVNGSFNTVNVNYSPTSSVNNNVRGGASGSQLPVSQVNP